MDKHAIRIEIGELLDQNCRHCKLVAGHRSYSEMRICRSCPHYKKLRQLGDQLLIKEDKKNMPKQIMPVVDYVGYVNKGLSDQDIADRIGKDVRAVQSWRYNHKDEITKMLKIQSKIAKNEPKTEEKEPIPAKPDSGADRQIKALIADNSHLVAEKEHLIGQAKEKDTVIKALNLSLNEANKSLDNLQEENQRLIKRLAAAETYMAARLNDKL